MPVLMTIAIKLTEFLDTPEDGTFEKLYVLPEYVNGVLEYALSLGLNAAIDGEHWYGYNDLESGIKYVDLFAERVKTPGEHAKRRAERYKMYPPSADPTDDLVIYDTVPKDIRAIAKQLMGESLSKRMLERSIACLIYGEQVRARSCKGRWS